MQTQTFAQILHRQKTVWQTIKSDLTKQRKSQLKAWKEFWRVEHTHQPRVINSTADILELFGL